MRAIAFLTTAAALMLASCATSPAPNPSREAELAKAIGGRTAGKPVDCINLRRINGSHIIDSLAIVYTMSDKTVYVNRPATGASSLRSNDILVTDTHSDQLCSIDIVHLIDSATRTDTGSVGLGKFVPYPRGDRSAH